MATLKGSTQRTIHLSVFRAVVACVLSIMPLTRGIAAQSSPSSSPSQVEKKAAALDHIQNRKFAQKDIELIRENGGSREAIPLLKESFSRSSSHLERSKAASAIIRLGENDPTYWSFLTQNVEAASDPHRPNTHDYDANGHPLPGLSPSFKQWAKSENRDLTEAEEEATYLAPIDTMLLALTRDPRSIALLQRALVSGNYLVQVAAAKGLAELGDAGSVQLIIQAQNKAPADIAFLLAESLLYFKDDRLAQAAADRILPADLAAKLRQSIAEGHHPIS